MRLTRIDALWGEELADIIPLAEVAYKGTIVDDGVDFNHADLAGQVRAPWSSVFAHAASDGLLYRDFSCNCTHHGSRILFEDVCQSARCCCCCCCCCCCEIDVEASTNCSFGQR
jgi:hypothetical protein